MILSWIYDLTGEGFQRTKRIDELEEETVVRIPNAWKIATYASFVVILCLLTYNISVRNKDIRAGDIQSIAILPFDNFTGDDGLDYVAAGMHASLIIDMGKVGALRVIGKTSSRIYKDSNKSAPEIARELNVDALVEPSVSCYGDSICIQIRVITTFPEEKLLWAAEYKEDNSQILSLYKRITKQITDELLIDLSPKEEQLLTETRVINKEAYDAYLRGYQYFGDLGENSLNKSLEYLGKAIELEPEWAPLYSSMAKAWMGLQQAGHEPTSIAGPKIMEYLHRTLELDPDMADAHQIVALMAWVAEWDWDKSEREFLKALAANPNDALSRIYYAQLLYILQRPKEASEQAQLAYSLDPFNPFIQTLYSMALLCDGNCEGALKVLDDVLALDPEHTLANNALEKAAFRCGDYEDVMGAAKYHIPLEPVIYQEIEKIFEEKGLLISYKEMLRRLEVLMLTDYIINPVTIASKYHMVEQYDKAMDWIEKGYEVHDPGLPSISTGYYNLIHLYDNPRFIAILEKMKLPLPIAN